MLTVMSDDPDTDATQHVIDLIEANGYQVTTTIIGPANDATVELVAIDANGQRLTGRSANVLTAAASLATACGIDLEG
jgi:hypothetical protein